ncbi:MAG: DNA topoisomerase IB [Anaerolineaceae bacterium]|nr:DNA topoisomerase IB [Anaerolineaceae bacterium]
MLSDAHLRHADINGAGFSRQKKGKGFVYYDTKGNMIHDKSTREWIDSLVIPPAWKEVWISPHKNGHILATGRDNKGRKQYRYHPRWNKMTSEEKFGMLYKFGKALPTIRKVTESHLREHKLSRTRVLATIVRLLEKTLIRIGNAEYAEANESYGLTTLHDKHAHVKGGKVTFEFVGKSGKEHEITLADKRLAKIVKQCRDIPGYDLFQYYDENGDRQTIGSADVNAYLLEITGEPFTAKVFRTWGGSVLAIKYLCEECTDEPNEKMCRECVKYVSQLLGNTKSVCVKYYIHPLIMNAYRAGKLVPMYQRHHASRSPFGLSRAEQTLMTLIKE